MVTKSMMRTYEEKTSLLCKKKLNLHLLMFITIAFLRIKSPISLHACAFIPELPSDISTMGPGRYTLFEMINQYRALCSEFEISQVKSFQAVVHGATKDLS